MTSHQLAAQLLEKPDAPVQLQIDGRSESHWGMVGSAEALKTGGNGGASVVIVLIGKHQNTLENEASENRRILLGQYAELLNRFGLNSKEAAQLLAANRADHEFVELASIAQALKRSWSN